MSASAWLISALTAACPVDLVASQDTLMGKIVRTCHHDAMLTAYDTAPDKADRRWAMFGVCVLALLVGAVLWVGTLHDALRAHGDPDPGHHLIDALKPVLNAVPSGANVTHTDVVPPRWDSCDGIKSTYGWNPATVDATFATGETEADVVRAMTTRLAALGWSVAPNDGNADGVAYWQRVLPGGAVALARLFPPSGGQWEFDAQAPPAVFPSHGC